MPDKDSARETIFYNAVNMAGSPGYGTLRKNYARFGSWEKCWFRNRKVELDPEQEWAKLRKSGIGLVLAGDAAYPPLLAEIPDPPFGIYFKGSLATTVRATTVAIVGTRKATAAGKNLAEEFGRVLADTGCAVVSGLAFGVDAAAHAGAISARGPTVAVLANGLNRVYPASHLRLAEHIIEGGSALLSEYPPGSSPLAHRFLERNRIISGLSRAVLAIEVPERSGVLATARFALDQNRDLFVAPGPVDHPNYRGSHRLIRAGATLVAEPRDLLEDMGFECPAGPLIGGAETPEEENVLAVIRSAGRPLAIDEIIEAATLTSSMVNRTLTTLILKNAVREENGGYTVKQ